MAAPEREASTAARQGAAGVAALDVRLRVFLAALQPALDLASALSLPLSDVEDAVRAMYVQRHRERGLSFEQTARRINTSRRTVATIASRTPTANDLPFEHSRRIGLRREVIRILSSTRRVDRAAARKKLRVPIDVLERELEVLIEDGTITEVDGQLRLLRAWTSYEGATDAERLDSVRHFLRAVGSTLHRRFFVAGPDDVAFARVMTFSASRASLVALREEVYANLCGRVVEIDRDAPVDGTLVGTIAFCVSALEPRDGEGG